MFYYAELNGQNVATSVKMVKEKMDFPNHVLIETLDGDYLFKKYENGTWSTEKYLPDMGAIQLSEFEKLKEEDLNNKEAIAELYLLSMGGF